MHRLKNLWVPLFLGISCVMIHLFGSDAQRVERFYTGSFYRQSGKVLRLIFGQIPFSFGDILYGILIAFLFWKICSYSKKIIQNNRLLTKKALKIILRKLFIYGCCLYIVFSVLWGLNYGRIGIMGQLDLKQKKYGKYQLIELNKILTEKVNLSKQSLLNRNIRYPDNNQLFEQVIEAYGDASKKYPFMHYHIPSVKSSIWGWFGNYAGFTGYYNPFTGEAQVNTTVPEFIRPFITSHEIAHQLGYAKEMEANFVGFLAATHSTDTLLHYSAYLEMFFYANRNLYLADTTSSILYRNQLNDAVKQDIITLRKFNKEHESFLEPIVSWIYDKFLLSNRQPKGILSYNEVVGYLVAYYGIN